MKIREIMTTPAITIDQDESVAVAARRLTQFNIGVLPVCKADGTLCGVVTDRDLVTRCLASGHTAEQMKVRQVMTARVLSARPEMDTGVAASLMGREQVRRLPVVENGRLCGMVSLGDLAQQEESAPDVTDALTDITANISQR